VSENARTQSRIDDLYDAIEASGLNEMVGGGKPKTIGQTNLAAALEHLRLKPSDKVLDLGCGCGRTAIPLAQYLSQGEVVGIDIIRRQIEFCNKEIRPVLPNTRFFVTSEKNPMYDKFNQEDDAKDAINIDDFVQKFHKQFDAVVAFSVFTHFDPEMAARNFHFLASVLKPSGGILITAFLSAPWGDQLSADDHGFRDATPWPLTKVVFSLDRLAELAMAAGLRVTSVHFGVRSQGVPRRLERGSHAHDLLVLAKPQPVGWLDVGGPNLAAGWVWNQTAPDERLTVSVVVNGNTVATALADTYRPDLERAGIGDGRHAFNIRLPTATGPGDLIRCVVPDADYEIPREPV
jgi:SAM-dependent methyltransferase